jgi:hypothetical protein
MKTTIQNTNGSQIESKVTECTSGSEKQINWANQIKCEKIGQFLIMVLELKEESQKNQVFTAIEKLNTIIDSKFWIDNRSMTAKNIYKEVK